LERDGLVFFVESEKEDKVNNYVPAVDPRGLRFWDVVSSVTGHGIELKKGRAEAPLMVKVGEIYDRVKGATTSLPENVYLIDLIENADNGNGRSGRNADGGLISEKDA
jgi:hypothetical protein